MSRIAYTGAAVFDGAALHGNAALLAEDGRMAGIVAEAEIPPGYAREVLDGGTVMPGFVDLQVNGGGGVMFNDDQSPEALAVIARAHGSTGTLAILPTLITDTPERVAAALRAVEAAIAQGVPGIVGIHLEGPHLSVARKGAHDPELIRPMGRADEEALTAAAGVLPNVMVTVAPENVTPAQIGRLSEAGIVVSLGHSDCSFATAQAAIAAGASCVTHLFNAMSQLGNREPGLVGAALGSGRVSAGLIADGIHVHGATLRAALAAKAGPGRIFLVTDAMSTLGSAQTEFFLNGRRVLRRDGRLTLEDGTLAGADLTMPRAVAVVEAAAGVARAQALAMATSVPAAVLRDPKGHGRLVQGAPLRAIHLSAGGEGIRVLAA